MNRVVVAPISQCEGGGVLLTSDDLRFVESLGCERRRCEVISWRYLLRKELEEMGCDRTANISYNALGAPYIENSELHISVSHNATMVAIMISDEPCAIDIELLGRDFARVASRYLSDQDINRSTLPQKLFIAAVWSAKETLYKIAAAAPLDLLSDLRVEVLSPTSAVGTIVPQNRVIPLNISIVKEDNSIVVWT